MQQPCVFPPGYRFLPTNEELLGFFLLKKVCGESFKYDSRVLHECDIYKNEPWNLWEDFGGPTLNSGEDLYFFTELKKVTETASKNVSRKAASGTWKGDTSETKVYDSTSSSKKRLLGSWKTFHYLVQKKDIPKDQLSFSWIMHEYKLADSVLVPESRRVHDLVLCRLRRRDKKDNKRQASAMEEMDVREVDIPESSNNVKVPRVVKDDSSDVMCAVDQNEAPQNNIADPNIYIADTAPVYYVQPNPDAIINEQPYYTYHDHNDGLISHQQPNYLDYYDERLCIDTSFLDGDDGDVILDESSDDPSNLLEIQQPLQMQGPPDQAQGLAGCVSNIIDQGQAQGIIHDTAPVCIEQSELQNYDNVFDQMGLNDSSNVIQQQTLQIEGPDQFQGFPSTLSNNVGLPGMIDQDMTYFEQCLYLKSFDDLFN